MTSGCHPPSSMARLTLQEARHVLQLRDVVLPVAAVSLQQGEDPVVLAAGVGRVQSLQLLEDDPPRFFFRLGVLHPGNGLAAGRKRRNVSKWNCGNYTFCLFR